MTIFDDLKSYGGKWKVKSTRKLSKEELDMVSSAKVVDSKYGNSCCFFMKNGTTKYMPMSKDAASIAGDTLDLTAIDIVTLWKEDADDINRVRG